MKKKTITISYDDYTFVVCSSHISMHKKGKKWIREYTLNENKIFTQNNLLKSIMNTIHEFTIRMRGNLYVNFGF